MLVFAIIDDAPSMHDPAVHHPGSPCAAGDTKRTQRWLTGVNRVAIA
jgi:hypothetical protein